MLPDRVDRPSVETLRAILDAVDVGGRLRYIREFIWRGGTLQFVDDRPSGRDARAAWYTLTAEWAAAVLEQPPSPVQNGVVPARVPVLEGRWVRGRGGYELRVGIDLAVPTAIQIRTHRLLSHVPFVGRSPAQVEQGLSKELDAYVAAFLGRSRPVPEAAAIEAQRLRGLGLAA